MTLSNICSNAYLTPNFFVLALLGEHHTEIQVRVADIVGFVLELDVQGFFEVVIGGPQLHLSPVVAGQII